MTDVTIEEQRRPIEDPISRAHLGTRLEPATAAPAVTTPKNWQRSYVQRLFIGDAVAVVGANLIGIFLRFGSHDPTSMTNTHDLGGSAAIAGTPRLDGNYSEVGFAMAAIWLLVLLGSRAYEIRFLGTGSEEYKRVASASLRFAGTVALVALAFQLQVARGFMLLSFGLGFVFLMLHRFAARRLLYRGRTSGKWLHRVLVVGSESSASDLISEVRREQLAGFSVVAACVPACDRKELIFDADRVPVLGGLANVREIADQVNADTIAVAAAPGITSQVLRRLAWQLEGTGIDLIVAPSLTNVAGPRVSIRPVAGLPLLHVEEPEITGFRYLAKEIVERSFALVAGVLLLPACLAIAIAIKLDSFGPIFFRQTRVSRHGEEFEVLKFRSMYAGAEQMVSQLYSANEASGGVLFKMREDPRITPVGKWLRRFSIDELPQLWNVIRGDMALIGPRPPLPGEVAKYGVDVKRRLLVKPGMTGLWQVSGRSDLSWEDTVRLDLYYVENWSFALDAQILFKTLQAVVAARGAY